MPMRFSRDNRSMTTVAAVCAPRRTQTTSTAGDARHFVAMRQMVMENGDRGAPSAREPVGISQRGVLLIL